MKLKRGSRMMIYEDPGTERKPEGEALLLSKVRVQHFLPGVEQWNVRFGNESEVFQRFIKVPEGG